MGERGHRSLRVWQQSMDLAGVVYQATASFPREELFGLVSQMRRSAVSIPSNIAEGYGRGGRDYARFVSIAYGSLLELETQVELSRNLGFLEQAQAASLLGTTSEIGRMLNALKTSLTP
jgi:four helix bundle protein